MISAPDDPTRQQLEDALRVSGCTVDLDFALTTPALATALKITARILADQPAAPPSTANQSVFSGLYAPRPTGDFRMRAANDDTEDET